LRYRLTHPATITLKLRYAATQAQATLRTDCLVLSVYRSHSECEDLQKRFLNPPLAAGSEGMIELVAIGNKLIARLNESLVLTGESAALSPTGEFEVQC